MNGTALPSAAPAPVEFNGKTYLFEPLTLEDWGTIENHLLKRKREIPLDIAAAAYSKFPKDAAEQLRKDAFAESLKIKDLDPTEVFDFIYTREGIAFTTWLAFEKRYPGTFTLQTIWGIIKQMKQDDVDRLKQTRDEISMPNIPGENDAASAGIESGDSAKN